jgi:putative ABC transport system permease protein
MFRSKRPPADFDEEIRAHRALETDRLIREGASPEEARIRAARAFGNVTIARERYYESRRYRWLDHLALDVRCAIRGLRRWPGFTLLTILLLGVGTGAATALVSLVNGVLLTPPPYDDPARLVLVAPARKDGQPYRAPCTARQCGEWSQATAFDSAAAYFWIFDYLVLERGSVSLEGMAVSPEYFQVIGRTPFLGRHFTPAERSAQSHPVVLISDGLWRTRFQADLRIVGKTLTLSRHRTLTIVGVMPPGIRFLPAPLSEDAPGYDVNAMVDFWVPQTLQGFPPDVPIWNAVARLGRGVTLDEAGAEIAAIADRQAKATPALRELTATVEPIQAASNREPALLLVPLLSAAVCVLLIACANVGGLQLARGLRRDSELAVHAALGASQGRMVRQALAEQLVVGLLGGAAGAALACLTLTVLVRASGPSIPRIDVVVVDVRLLGWSVFLGLLTGLVAGLPTAIRLLGRRGLPGLDRSGQDTRVSRGGRRTLQVLTGAQIAVTLALLAGAGLLLRSLHNVAGVPLGYQTENALTMMVTDVRGDWQTFHRRALERVEGLPGVIDAAFAWGLPLTRTGASTRVRFGGASGPGVTVPVRAVTPSFFDLLGMTIIEGRPFRDTDGPETRSVAIITAATAAKYFPGVNPIGRVIVVPGWQGEEREIVGVVSDVRAQSVTQPTGPELYLPLVQATAFSKHLIVRTRADPLAVAPAVQSALRELDPTASLESIKTFAQIKTDSMARHRLAATVTSTFGAVACVLAAAGVYGSLAWSVARRRREFAIRVALGADRRRVVAVVLGDLARPLLGGALAGFGLAVVLSNALRAWLFGIDAYDPATFLAAAALLVLVTLGASWLPARSALGVDPNAVLRSE